MLTFNSYYYLYDKILIMATLRRAFVPSVPSSCLTSYQNAGSN